MKIEVNNSFSKLSGDIPEKVLEAIIEKLTYYNEEAVHEKISLLGALKGVRYRKWGARGAALKALESSEKKIRWKIKYLEKPETIWPCLLKSDLSFGTGLLTIVENATKNCRHIYKIIEKRVKPEANQIFRWYNPPLKLRYYQQEMVDLGVEKHRGVFASAVGSGKTEIAIHLVKALSVTSMVIVPSKDLKTQIGNDFIRSFGLGKVDILDTKKVEQKTSFKPIMIVTVQTLRSLQKRKLLHKIINGLNAIFIDEIHLAGAETYTNLMPEFNNIYYKFGFSGTFKRNDSKTLELWSILSDVLYSYKPKKAMEDGFLTKTEFIIHKLPGKSSAKYPTEYKNNYCGGLPLLKEILKIVENLSGKTCLILVNRKDTSGKLIHKMLKNKGISNIYISGDDKESVRCEALKDYNDGKIKILVGSQILGVGINIKPVEVLVNAQGNKSEIATVQAIGRGVRLYKGKDKLVVHDFQFSGTKYLEKHLEIRLDIYFRNFGGKVTWT